MKTLLIQLEVLSLAPQLVGVIPYQIRGIIKLPNYVENKHIQLGTLNLASKSRLAKYINICIQVRLFSLAILLPLPETRKYFTLFKYLYCSHCFLITYTHLVLGPET